MNPKWVVLAGVVLLALGGAAWLLLRAPAPDPESDWTLDLTDVPSGTADAIIPDEARALVDRLASSNEQDATLAWIAIGARYKTSDAFLSEMRPALYDPRPIPFSMTRESFSGGGLSFVYFSPKTNSSKGVPAYAHSVGQSLCYHLWQYEDVSNSGFHGDFLKWWGVYAPAHGLPGPR